MFNLYYIVLLSIFYSIIFIISYVFVSSICLKLNKFTFIFPLSSNYYFVNLFVNFFFTLEAFAMSPYQYS